MIDRIVGISCVAGLECRGTVERGEHRLADPFIIIPLGNGADPSTLDNRPTLQCDPDATALFHGVRLI
jgi:hypothetical protein